MPNNSRDKRRTRPNNISPNRPVLGQTDARTEPNNQPESEPELTGFIGWLARNRRLLGWLELIVAILLLGLALNGFLGGGLYMPLPLAYWGCVSFILMCSIPLERTLGVPGKF